MATDKRMKKKRINNNGWYQEASLREVDASSRLADGGEQLALDLLIGEGDLGERTAKQLVLRMSIKV